MDIRYQPLHRNPLTQTRLRSRNATPVPYKAGDLLQLKVLQNCCGLPISSPTLTVSIVKIFDVTMSTVLDVVFETDSGSRVQAVLKLYDRRFGRDIRSGVCVHKDGPSMHYPHSAPAEARFQSFVREGKVGPFLEELEQEKRSSDIPLSTARSYDKTPDGPVKYEAALYLEFREHFECETEAYARLGDFQGNSIPQIFAHISLCSAPPDLLEPSMASYFVIKGVLLQRITGFNLFHLSTSPTLDPGIWLDIIHRAMDATRDINLRGIILLDCSARNVVVEGGTNRLFIIDFAQCEHKDKLIADMLAYRESQTDSSEDEDFDGDVEYLENVRFHDNTGAIGCVMAGRIERLKGVKLAIRYPDWEKMMEDVMRSKGNMREAG